MLNKPVINFFTIVFLSLVPLGLMAADGRFIGKKVPSFHANDSLEHIPSESLSWIPQIEGKTRYQFKIPTEGLRQAAKYRDAASLYYLSSIRDFGLKFSNSNSVSVQTTPKSIGFNWFAPSKIQNARYSLGLEYSAAKTKVAQTTLSLGYAYIFQQRVLVSIRLAGAKVSTVQGAFGATFLNDAETVQYSGWLRKSFQNDGQYKVALQRTTYEAWRDTDTSVTLSQSNEGFSFSTAVYNDIGAVKTSLGLTWYEQSKNLGIFGGITFDLRTKSGTFVKLYAASASGQTFPKWLDDLKSLRLRELMGHWRYGMRFSRNENEP